MFIQQSLLEKVLLLCRVAINKCMYVKYILQHNNLSPTSLLITLTVFVADATNSPIYKHRPEVTFGPIKPSIRNFLEIVRVKQLVSVFT